MKLTASPLGAGLALAGLAVVGLVAWSAWRRVSGGGSVVADVAAGAASAAVEVAGNAAAGVVVGVGDALGVPRTNETECARALREGRLWDASFACPAADFIGGAWRAVADGTPAGPTREGGASGGW